MCLREPRDVSEEQLNRVIAIWQRYKQFMSNQLAGSKQRMHDSVRKFLGQVRQMDDFNDKNLFVEQLNTLLELVLTATSCEVVYRYEEQLDQIQQLVANETSGVTEVDIPDFLAP